MACVTNTHTHLVARNLVLLTMILAEGEDISNEDLWDIYYHMYLDDQTIELVGRHVQTVIPLLESLESFNRSPYGSIIKICDEDTLHDVCKALQRISDAAERDNREKYTVRMTESLKISKEEIENMVVRTGLRSAAPLASKAKPALPRNFFHYWGNGIVMMRGKTTTAPNPMLAGLLSDYELLHYGSDPLLGFHVATAFQELSDMSPLRPDEEDDDDYKVAAAARTQFFAWVHAFKSLKDTLCVRLVVSDAFAFCHTLQYAHPTGQLSANWYRRMWDPRVLCLDKALYGHTGSAPARFDAITTSNLADHFGLLNVLVSASPLLKPKMWARLFTEQLFDNSKQGRQSLDELLYGPAPTVFLLLGLTPVQYCLNAKDDSHADDIFIALMGRTKRALSSQFRTRLAWICDDQFAGYEAGRPKIHMKWEDVSYILYQWYIKMFQDERLGDANAPVIRRLPHPYPLFHRGSFIALLQLVKSRVQTDWDYVFEEFLDTIEDDRAQCEAGRQAQDFYQQLFLSKLYIEDMMFGSDDNDDDYDNYEDDDSYEYEGDDFSDIPELPKPTTGPLREWVDLPPVVAVTVVVNRNAVNHLFLGPYPSSTVPTLVGILKNGVTAPSKWLTVFDDVHLVFGRVTTSGDMMSGDADVKIQQDELGWSGTAPLVATFLVPTALLLKEPVSGLVGLGISMTAPDGGLFATTMDQSYVVYETILSNTARVFLSKHMPGTSAHKIMGGGVRQLHDKLANLAGQGPVTLSAGLPSDKQQGIVSLTARVQVSAEGQRLLLQDRTMKLSQDVHSTICVTFAKGQLTLPCRYPLPVVKDGMKVQLDRGCNYVDVTVHLANPGQFAVYRPLYTGITSDGLPMALSISHINLDHLPIIGLTNRRLPWLKTLASLQFSVRERRRRQPKTDSLEVYLKESISRMCMASSVSSVHTSGKTGEFQFCHWDPLTGAVQMLILVSAVRLDGDAASVVLDAAVIPLTWQMMECKAMIQFVDMVSSRVSSRVPSPARIGDVELKLWKSLIPSMVERCRTWNHLPTCEYTKKGATVPLSLRYQEQWLCSCGNGQFPDNYLALPGWDAVAQYAVRLAISPLFSVPFVEPIMSENMVDEENMHKKRP